MVLGHRWGLRGECLDLVFCGWVEQVAGHLIGQVVELAKAQRHVVGDDRLVLAAAGELVATLLEQVVEPLALPPADGVICVLANQDLRLKDTRLPRPDDARRTVDARGGDREAGLSLTLADKTPRADATHVETVGHRISPRCGRPSPLWCPAH